MPKTICLFNHKGGVSKTTTSFNLGWGIAGKGHRVMLADLDSQCNLSGLILGYSAVSEEKMDAFYSRRDRITMKPIVNALLSGKSADEFERAEETGELLQTKNRNLFLLPGHLDVSDLDSQISLSLKIAAGVPVTRSIPGNLPKIIKGIAERAGCEYVIYDMSPNVGGLNEVILMSSDYFIVPASPDYFCLQAIGSLEKHIRKWHKEIKRFREDNKFDNGDYAIGNSPLFLGAIQQRYRPRNEKPAKSFQRWIDMIRREINGRLVPSLDAIGCVCDMEKMKEVLTGSELEPYDLAHVSDFNSLIAISQQLSKPIFALTEQEIGGRVFGQAKRTMLESRDAFCQCFEDLTERVIKLTR